MRAQNSATMIVSIGFAFIALFLSLLQLELRNAPRAAAWRGYRVKLSRLAGHPPPDLRLERRRQQIAVPEGREDGRPDEQRSLFNEMHSGRRDRDVILYAFDLLDLNGKDQRDLALEERKARLGDLLAPTTNASVRAAGGLGVANRARRHHISRAAPAAPPRGH
jgi:hypothetical protein